MYAIADGTHVDRSCLDNQGNGWFNPHCRLLGVVDFKIKRSNDIIFIIGSDEVSNPGRFLQVVSWDGEEFHYYAVCIYLLTEDDIDNHRSKTSMATRDKGNGPTKPALLMPSRTGHHPMISPISVLSTATSTGHAS